MKELSERVVFSTPVTLQKHKQHFTLFWDLSPREPSASHQLPALQYPAIRYRPDPTATHLMTTVHCGTVSAKYQLPIQLPARVGSRREPLRRASEVGFRCFCLLVVLRPPLACIRDADPVDCGRQKVHVAHLHHVQWSRRSFSAQKAAHCLVPLSPRCWVGHESKSAALLAGSCRDVSYLDPNCCGGEPGPKDLQLARSEQSRSKMSCNLGAG